MPKDRDKRPQTSDDEHFVPRLPQGFVDEDPSQTERYLCGGRGFRDFQDDDAEDWDR